MATERGLIEVMGVLAAAYPTFPLTKETISVYARVLTDIPDELLQMASLDSISKGKFFPTLAELRDSAISIRTNRAGQPSAFEAWEEVARLIRRKGHGDTPEFSNPWIATAVRQIGGWNVICMSENMTADRARFFEAFQDAERRNDAAERTLPQVKELALRMGSARRPELGHPR